MSFLIITIAYDCKRLSHSSLWALRCLTFLFFLYVACFRLPHCFSIRSIPELLLHSGVLGHFHVIRCSSALANHFFFSDVLTFSSNALWNIHGGLCDGECWSHSTTGNHDTSRLQLAWGAFLQSCHLFWCLNNIRLERIVLRTLYLNYLSW